MVEKALEMHEKREEAVLDHGLKSQVGFQRLAEELGKPEECRDKARPNRLVQMFPSSRKKDTAPRAHTAVPEKMILALWEESERDEQGPLGFSRPPVTTALEPSLQSLAQAKERSLQCMGVVCLC
ncbi:hypothetical protein CTA1_644 [Colletotrichum tanaceti]|uniref:Uncharacterized protein n=1 Tax=Colletotrichum tanaceti TaxID=1306861 RepID=A0A4U6XSP9_9PEZI|nr:hypothetical protein CTA1_644 [Colletotrichum tanaceti]